MSNIEREIRQVISDIYDNSLPKNMVKTIIGKTMARMASSKLVEENAKQRNIRIVASVMDTIDAFDNSEEDYNELFGASSSKGAIVVESSSESLSWDDIKHAFNDDFLKVSASDRRTVDEGMEYDKCHKELLREGVTYEICHDYGDPDNDEYDEEARAYPIKSMKENVSNVGEKFPVGIDRRKKLQPGNLLDEAVDSKRTRADFSTA